MAFPAQALTQALLKRYRRLKQKKYRQQDQCFLVEGERLSQDILASPLALEAVIIAAQRATDDLPEDVPIYTASRTQLEQLADSRSPQDLMLIAKCPPFNLLPHPDQAHRILLLDRIADPGNLGTILRSALWFDVTHVVLGRGCVDPYSPKVVRASMGALAHLSLSEGTNLVETAQTWQAEGGELYALHMDGQPLYEAQPGNPAGIIVGSEAHGVEPALLKLATPLAIPRQGGGESLNAAMATSIALYAFSGAQR